MKYYRLITADAATTDNENASLVSGTWENGRCSWIEESGDNTSNILTAEQHWEDVKCAAESHGQKEMAFIADRILDVIRDHKVDNWDLYWNV